MSTRRLYFPLSHLIVLDCHAPDRETLVDFANACKPGTTFELLDLDSTSSGDPAGGHLVVLRDELPVWQAAAREYGVRLVETNAPVRLGRWPGDAIVQSDGPDHVIIEIAC